MLLLPGFILYTLFMVSALLCEHGGHRIINLLDSGKQAGRNCRGALPRYPLTRPLKTNGDGSSEIQTVFFSFFTFAATAVRQLGVWGLAGLPAPMPRIRLGLRRLLPGQGPVLCLGWTQLLAVLPHWQKVCRRIVYFFC